MTKSLVRTHAWLVCVSWLVLMRAVAIAAPNSGDTDVLEEFDVARGGDMIIVPVSVVGEGYHFLLDTGFTCSCFNKRHRPLLGEPTRVVAGKIPGSSNSIEQFAGSDLKLGSIPLHCDAEVGCVDLSDIERAAGRAVDGILGMDALDQLVLNIDFDAGKVRVLRSAQNAKGRVVPIIWHQRRHMREGPFIMAQIDGDLQTEFLVDTGAICGNLGSIDVKPFDFLQSEGVIQSVGSWSSGTAASGPVRTQFGRLRKISIANYEHTDVLIQRLPFWNTLGLGFLSRYVATFDFPNSVAYLSAGESFGWPEATNRSGIILSRGNQRIDEVVVEKVRDGTAGQAAGIKAGDLLLSINGHPVTGWSLYRAQRQLCASGMQRLRVRRGSEDLEVGLLLTDDKNASDPVGVGTGSRERGAPPGTGGRPTTAGTVAPRGR
jgi:hypothetical protein